MNPAGGVGPALRNAAQPELLTQATRSARLLYTLFAFSHRDIVYIVHFDHSSWFAIPIPISPIRHHCGEHISYPRKTSVRIRRTTGATYHYFVDGWGLSNEQVVKGFLSPFEFPLPPCPSPPLTPARALFCVNIVLVRCFIYTNSLQPKS